ncbi:MAG TPA: hypothetical protein VGE98_01155 [Thermoanaerobaculia bacterium]
MLRLLIELLTVVYLVWQLRELYRRTIGGGPPRQPTARPSAPRQKPPPEDPAALTLVRCARCGVHVPRSQARGNGDGGAYLCDACSRNVTGT